MTKTLSERATRAARNADFFYEEARKIASEYNFDLDQFYTDVSAFTKDDEYASHDLCDTYIDEDREIERVLLQMRSKVGLCECVEEDAESQLSSEEDVKEAEEAAISVEVDLTEKLKSLLETKKSTT